jgi:signal transduction histidine kinase/ActR/RegA family two-component response regulator
MGSHRSRLLLLVLAALFSVAVLATAWVVDVAGREEERLERSARANAQEILSRVDGKIAHNISALEALAASPLIDSGDMAAFRVQLKRAIVHRPLWQNVVLSDLNGRQELNLRFAETAVGDRRSFEAVVETGKPVVSDVSLGIASGRTTVVVRVPVERTGKIAYVLTAALDPDRIAELLAGSLPKAWGGLILDRTGHIVVRSSDGAAAIGRLAGPPAREAVAKNLAGQVRHGADLAGVAVLVMHLKSELTGWSVHVVFPLSELSIFQTNSVLLAIAGAIVSVVLAGVLCFLIVREARRDRRHMAAVAESERLEAIGQIAGGVAHDFNNLLMIIQSAAQMIRRRKQDAEAVSKYAEALSEAAQRGAALTKQLLSYGRKDRHSPMSFALRELAGNLSTLLNQSTRGDIRHELIIPDNVWPIHADPTALELALINLATNARDAMPLGGALTVTAKNATLDGGIDVGGLKGDFVAISVADTGAGISTSDLPHIFEPFFTTKPPGQGTGLGLSQVYGFAKQSGGAVTVASIVGEGTTFTIYLPRAHETVSAPLNTVAEPRPGGVGRILLVEDNPDVAQAVEEMLEAAGYTVVRVASAAEALTHIERYGPFHCVVSDIVMPGEMSGIELEARLREGYPKLPVILMTGYSEALARGKALGRIVLSKPFTEAELLGALKRAAPSDPAASLAARTDTH